MGEFLFEWFIALGFTFTVGVIVIYTVAFAFDKRPAPHETKIFCLKSFFFGILLIGLGLLINYYQ